MTSLVRKVGARAKRKAPSTVTTMFSPNALRLIGRGMRWALIAAVMCAALVAIDLVNLLYLTLVITVVTEILIPWVVTSVFFVIALVGIRRGLQGLHSRQAPSLVYGRLGTAGYRVALLGVTLLLVETIYFGVVGALGTIFGLGIPLNTYPAIVVLVLLYHPIFLAVGSGLLGAATLRAKVLPRWFGIIITFFLPLIALVPIIERLIQRELVGTSAQVATAISELISILYHAGLGLFCIALGYVLWKTAPPGTRIPSLFRARAFYRKLWGWAGISNKTLWDWAQLSFTASIPLVIAVGGFMFSASQNGRNAEITENRAQEEALQGYLNEMSKLMADGELRKSEPESEERILARARTLTVLSRFSSDRNLEVSETGGSQRKGRVLEFLYESNLIARDKPYVSLVEADLRDASLREANLNGADLQGAELWDAALEKADLQGANLQKVVLNDANLSSADLRGADLQGARLFRADIRGADLREAVGLSQDSLRELIGDQQTQLPEGLEPPIEEWQSKAAEELDQLE